MFVIDDQPPENGSHDDGTLLRVRLPDRPGSLALLTGRLASFGIDILRLEVVSRIDGMAVDDLLLGGDASAEAALRELRPRVEVIGAVYPANPPDPGLAMADACQRLEAASGVEEACGELLAGALRIAGASSGLLLAPLHADLLRPIGATSGDLHAVASGTFPLAAEAIAAGRPAVALGSDAWADVSLRERLPRGPAIAVPVGAAPLLVLVVVRRHRLPFTPLEARRLHALAGIAAQVLTRHDAQLAFELLVEPQREARA